MNTPNIGWLYFKDYLRVNNSPFQLFNRVQNLNKERSEEIFKEHFAVKNQEILEQEFSANVSTALNSELAKSNISLKTTYPGLTLGTGYTHEINETGEFKLGFFFDHTTGYPCIPGSTVKGCLRGMFPQKERKEVADKDEKYNYLASVIRQLPTISDEKIRDNKLGSDFDPKIHDEGKQFIDFLERELFDGEKPERNEEGSFKMKDGKIVFQPICVYERDIFFDAYLGATEHPAINRSSYKNPKPFIGDDYITPHINRKKPELSPFTNPVPLMFLKILPEVTIQFQFDLKDGLLTKEQKQELFRRLLLDFGIGAKTNVGYGQFNEGTVSSLNVKRAPMSLNLPDDHIPDNTIPLLKQNSSFPGEMIEQIGEYNLYQFTVGREVCKVKKRKDKNPALLEGDKVTILIKLDYKKGASLAFQVK